jgi:hypothetical protein
MRADDKLETNKLYYQLDPLSRRSLLIHPATLELESGSSTDFFALSSARSAHAREWDRDEGTGRRRGRDTGLDAYHVQHKSRW